MVQHDDVMRLDRRCIRVADLFLLILLILLLALVAVTKPAAVNRDQFQDKILSRHHDVHRYRRTAVVDDSLLWTNATIPFTFNEFIEEDSSLVEAIVEAMEIWQQRTCIKFERINRTEIGAGQIKKFVKFIYGSVCQSDVGMSRDTGQQNVSIAADCAIPEMIAHELGHLIGLWHEHARYDRDAHVYVTWDNIRDDHRYNFHKLTNMRLMAPYDMTSLMHYAPKTLSTNGQAVLIPLNDDLTQVDARYQTDVTFYDALTVNKLYKCSDRCESLQNMSADCEKNGGYVGPNCVCVCPRLLTGNTCQRVQTDHGCGGIFAVNQPTTITSLNYPNKYPHNADCTWLLTVRADSVIQLNVEDLLITRSCKDFLEIRHSNIGIEHGFKLCGRVVNKTFITRTSRAIVKFHSNSVNSARGFKLVAQPAPKQDCASMPCLHGASCQDVSTIETYLCNCSEGWIGQNCEIQIKEGGWSAWTQWSACAAQCGIRTRTRTCTDPAPSYGGQDCRGTREQSQRCAQLFNDTVCYGQLQCDFGRQSTTIDPCPGLLALPNTDFSIAAATSFRWILKTGSTPSKRTGPSAGHTTGLDDDAYVYVEASYGQPYSKSTFWLSRSSWLSGFYCLQFFYHMFGNSTGSLTVNARSRDTVSTPVWRRSGCHGDSWHEAVVTIRLFGGVTIGFEGQRGDSYDSDIALDDVSVSRGKCLTNSSTNGCVYKARQLPVGSFTDNDIASCRNVNCFCNVDGHVDCQQWNTRVTTTCRPPRPSLAAAAAAAAARMTSSGRGTRQRGRSPATRRQMHTA